ncbi:MAG: HDOD domain-containing protein, partial [Pirellulales bacterium]
AATGVEEAVVRIGQKRTGELALAMSTIGALKAESHSWIDVALTWRRSLAAGLAVDLLIATAGHSTIGAGLFLAAIVHPLGRIVLSTLYPERYAEMLALSQQTGEPLRAYEERIFRRTQAEIMASLLETWNLPVAVFEPLAYSRHQAAAVSQLAEPLRTRVELIQLAILVGRLAIGRWQPWDLVEFPRGNTLRKLGIDSLGDLIQQTRLELEAIGQLTAFEATRPLRGANALSAETACLDIAYCNLSKETIDVVAEILRSMAIIPRPCLPADLSLDMPAIVNCTGISLEDASRVFSPSHCHILVIDSEDTARPVCPATLLTLPNSFGEIRSTLLKAANENAEVGDHAVIA